MPIPDEIWKTIETAPGWCWRAKADRIYDIASEPEVTSGVEIGVFGARSFLPFVLGVRKKLNGRACGYDVYQPHKMSGEGHQKYWDTMDYDGVRRGAEKLLSTFEYGPVMIQRLSSRAASFYHADDSLQYIHIDGSHRTWDAIEDIIIWAPKLQSRGYMLLDDTNWEELLPAVLMMSHGDFEKVETLKNEIDGKVAGETQIWRKK